MKNLSIQFTSQLLSCASASNVISSISILSRIHVFNCFVIFLTCLSLGKSHNVAICLANLHLSIILSSLLIVTLNANIKHFHHLLIHILMDKQLHPLNLYQQCNKYEVQLKNMNAFRGSRKDCIRTESKIATKTDKIIGRYEY